MRGFSLPEWVHGYAGPQLGADLAAAVVITMLLVPQGLAYAALAGLPPQMGLYASMLPLVAYAFLGSSMVLSVGPVAIASLMTASALAPLAEPGSATYIAAAVMLAMLSGLMLLLFGFLRLGAMAQFLSHPVVSGFISGAAVMIIIGQLQPLLGIQANGETAVALLMALPGRLSEVQPLTAITGAGALLFLVLGKYALGPALVALGLKKERASVLARLSPMMIVLASIGLVAVMGWGGVLQVVGPMPQGLPSLSLPLLDPGLIQALLLPALLISLVGFVEGVSIAQAFASRHNVRINANAELRGLGAANLASAFSGGFPVTGGFSRTAVNAEAGARTPMSGVFAAALVALVLMVGAGLFAHLPMSVLAATIIVAATGLVDIRTLRQTWHYDRAEGAALLSTFAGVLLAGVETGILVGIVLSLATLVWRASRPHIAQVGRVPGTEHFRNVKRYTVETRPELLMLRVDENLFFANAESVEDRILKALGEQPRVENLVLLMSSVSNIDATALSMLLQLNERLMKNAVSLHFAEIKGPVMEQLDNEGFPEQISGQIYLSANEAYEALLE